ncbi:MAG: hypothetical protein ACQEQC_07225 [Elusimicrobiota bacterium]
MIKEKKEIPFVIALSYLLGFLGIRLAVFLAGSAHTEFARAAKISQMPDVSFHIGRNIILFGYHIHHFYFGVILICVAGWFAIAGSEDFSRKALAIMYGLGLGLFFDEIGLLLTWGDYYSSLSYLLSLFLAGIFLNIVFFHGFWENVKDNFTGTYSNSLIYNTVMKHNSFLKIANKISKSTGRAQKTSLIFTGILYVLIAYVVFNWPRSLRYWVSIVFIIQGLNYLVEFLTASEE